MTAGRTILTIRRLLLRACEELAFLPPAVARLTVGMVFATSGWGKLHNLEQVTAFFTELGLPMPGPTAAFTATVELVGGFLLLLGLASRLASVPLLVTMVVAIVTAKKDDIASLADLLGTVEFAYIALLAWIAVSGPGALSVDHVIARRLMVQVPMGRSAPATT